MMIRALIAILVLLFSYAQSGTASAQTGTPSNWRLKFYQAGTQTQVGTTITVAAPQVQCNQAPPANSATENPTKWVWTDVVNAGKVCIFDDTTRIAALPDGAYEGTAQALNADGASAESARAPFSRRRPNPPAAPTGVSFAQ